MKKVICFLCAVMMLSVCSLSVNAAESSAVEGNTPEVISEIVDESEVSIDDEMSYEGLIGGEDYVVRGVLKDKETGEEISEAYAYFKADKSGTGKVKLTYKVEKPDSATSIEGKSYLQLFYSGDSVGLEKMNMYKHVLHVILAIVVVGVVLIILLFISSRVKDYDDDDPEEYSDEEGTDYDAMDADYFDDEEE